MAKKELKPFGKFTMVLVIKKLIDAGIEAEAAINEVVGSYAYSAQVKEGLKQRIRAELGTPLVNGIPVPTAF